REPERRIHQPRLLRAALQRQGASDRCCHQPVRHPAWPAHLRKHTTRVSTLLSQQIGIRTMATQEAKMLHTMQQLASGKRLLTPADDPLAAAQSVNVAQTESMNVRYGVNRGIAEMNLASEENVLNNITLGLQEVLGRVVEAGNGAYSDTERGILANVLKQSYESLLGNANATDGNGQYLFSGDMGNVAPYDKDAVYKGNDGERLIQVGQTRQMSS